MVLKILKKNWNLLFSEFQTLYLVLYTAPLAAITSTILFSYIVTSFAHMDFSSLSHSS